MMINAPQISTGSALQPGGNSARLVDTTQDNFARLFEEVNSLQNQADQKMEEFATSSNKDIHGTMIAMQKADLSLRLFMQMRAKLTSAYQEIMRTQM